ncbi:hypothetical protein DB30_03984 [Enhygromyxa salina]|uniref:N-ATPase, AtpR subunit n=1 Tax=Enhygromyxa salina TaxID=215803 RepID=A0A0C2DA99_9BACT|nr:ATP synthase subunit I [Enhygromyxa salina]KIG16822.1 hypothetical protein DB30_03984 [Enhygromyxa salina]
MTAEQLARVLAGFSIGVAAGAVYLLLLRRSVRALVQRREAASMLRSAPARVAAPVLVLVLMARWDPLALLGSVVGLLLTQIAAQLSARTRSFEP